MKASMTVEAAFVCPFLCLIICSMLLVTMQLYDKVEEYSVQLQSESRDGVSATELIRMEAVLEEIG